MQLRPMRVVLGGPVAIDNVVGRHRETAAILSAVGLSLGALLTGDRRFGKTVLRRVAVEELRRAGVPVVEISAERESLADFVEALEVALRGLGGVFEKALRAMSITEVGVPGILRIDRDSTAHRDLDSLIRKAIEAAAPTKLVLVIDEVTVLASALERQRAGDGKNFLHLLRRLRQDNEGRLAMVLLGSIGFHHVTTDAMSTVNDLEIVPVRHIPLPEASYLAGCLLLGESVPVTDGLQVADAIAFASEQIPYYVHHLVRSAQRWTSRLRQPIGPQAVPGLVDEALADPDDPWNLKHYSERVPIYYGADAETVGAVLDVLALAPTGVDDLLRSLGTVPLAVRPTRAALVGLVKRLEADHYLRADGPVERFASEIVRRAWLAARR